MYMQANATNFQYSSIFGSIRHKWFKMIKQINKQHKHQSISELEFQIHNSIHIQKNHVFDANSQQCVLTIYKFWFSHQSNGNI